MGCWQEHCRGALEQGAQSACPGQITVFNPSYTDACVINRVYKTVFSPLGIIKNVSSSQGISFHHWINISGLLDSLWWDMVAVTHYDWIYDWGAGINASIIQDLLTPLCHMRPNITKLKVSPNSSLVCCLSSSPGVRACLLVFPPHS